MRNPHVLQLIMDSLRYWVTEMHVDGFRFDLAASLARQFHEVDRLSAFFDLVQQDPVVSQVKLIAEPWDVGPGGYQVGNFPPAVDGVERQVPRHRPRLLARRAAPLGEFANRLSGSSDLYESDGRAPYASINFVTAHDGFTLRDLVSYNEKHNEANGEDNNDGENHNRSWNCGVEGETDDPERARAAGAAAAQPADDAAAQPGRADAAARRRARPHPARQQQRLLPGQRAVLDRLVVGRRGPGGVRPAADRAAGRAPGAAPAAVLHRHRRMPTGSPTSPGCAPTAAPMGGGDLGHRRRAAFAVYYNGQAITEPGTRGEEIDDDSFLLLLNSRHATTSTSPCPTVPTARSGCRCWTRPTTTSPDDERPGVPAGNDPHA